MALSPQPASPLAPPSRLVLAPDVSKYTTGLDANAVAAWKTLGVGLVIVQSHPAGYGRDSSLALMQTLSDGGLRWDAYIYQYMGDAGWTEGALQTLDLAASKGLVPRRLWLDVEDVDTERGWTAAQRVDAVRRDLGVLDQWSNRHQLLRAGIYSGRWYWGWDGAHPCYMGNATDFSDRPWWPSQYDGIQDAGRVALYGGWSLDKVCAKQFAGTSVLADVAGVDLGVLSAMEAARL